MQAFPAIAFGLPSLMDTPFAKSQYQFNEWHGLAKILSDYQYKTSFFHAAEAGSMYFDNMAYLSGVKDYYPMEKYPHPEKDFDGHWGIFDEPFLQFAKNKFDTFEPPFFSIFFSLSSHQPYAIPDKYQGRFPKGNHPIAETIAYTDHALREFFQAAKSSPWYKNTLFIITADHTQMGPSHGYESITGRYMVPILFFHPDKDLKMETIRIAQHADIEPSILDYLGLKEEPSLKFGSSLFAKNEGRAIFYANSTYRMVKDKQVIEWNRVKDEFMLYEFQQEPKTLSSPTKISPKDDLAMELKAFVSYHDEGLAKNCLYKKKCINSYEHVAFE
tara:strand:- start:8645 stop:9634 length:990 start_codon:yes stop_codon:yes gene_type:complete